MTKQCKALELLDRLRIKQIGLSTDHIDAELYAIEMAVFKMQDEHHEAMSKAAGEWVFCRNTAPDVSGRYLIELPNGSLEKVRYDTVDKSWIDSAGLERDPRRWFKPATPPPRPPIEQPEPEIEVPDLDPGMHFGVDSDTFACCNEAHKAAMRPVLKELAELRATLRLS